MDSVGEFVACHFPEAKRVGRQWRARCPIPCHGRGRGDRNPSLSISEGHDGRVLLHCFAGCSNQDICQALNIEQRDLFLPRRAQR